MAVKFTVPVTSNCLELRIRVSRFSPEQSAPEISVNGTPYINIQTGETEDDFYLSVFLASLVQNQALSAYTNGEITLQINTWDSHAVTVSAVCLSAQQAPISFDFTGEIPLTITPYTSKPYPVMFDDAVNLSHVVILSGSDAIPMFGDPVELSQVTITGGELREPLIHYDRWEPEAVNLSQVAIASGELREILKKYQNWEPESVNLSQVTISGGTMDQVLIRYQNWEPEYVNLSHVSITSGTLS